MSKQQPDNRNRDSFLEREYPTEKFKLKMRYFNLMVHDGQHRYAGLFYRERKWKGKVGHWLPVKDKEGHEIVTKVA